MFVNTVFSLEDVFEMVLGWFKGGLRLGNFQERLRIPPQANIY